MYISPTLLKILEAMCQEKLGKVLKEVSVISYYDTSTYIYFNCLAMTEKDGSLKTVKAILPKG